MIHDETDEGVQAAMTGELSLLKVPVRQSPSEVEAILHPDFFEFDPSGKRWDRAGAIAALAAQQAPDGQATVADLSDLKGVRLADDIVFVTYISSSGGRESNRSSIWRKTPDGWRLYFHQGTMALA